MAAFLDCCSTGNCPYKKRIQDTTSLRYADLFQVHQAPTFNCQRALMEPYLSALLTMWCRQEGKQDLLTRIRIKAVHVCRLQGYWVVVATSGCRIHMYDASTVYTEVLCHRYVSVVIDRCLDLILVEYPIKLWRSGISLTYVIRKLGLFEIPLVIMHCLSDQSK